MERLPVWRKSIYMVESFSKNRISLASIFWNLSTKLTYLIFLIKKNIKTKIKTIPIYDKIIFNLRSQSMG